MTTAKAADNPMRFEQVRDALDHVIEYHDELADEYRKLAKQAHDERVRMLLVYLAGHEDKLRQGLERYESGDHRSVLNPWMRNAPDPVPAGPSSGVNSLSLSAGPGSPGHPPSCAATRATCSPWKRAMVSSRASGWRDPSPPAMVEAPYGVPPPTWLMSNSSGVP